MKCVFSSNCTWMCITERCSWSQTAPCSNHKGLSKVQCTVTIDNFPTVLSTESQGCGVCIFDGNMWSTVMPQTVPCVSMQLQLYTTVHTYMLWFHTVRHSVMIAFYAVPACVPLCTLIMTAVPAMERLWKTLHCCLTLTGIRVRCTHSHQWTRSITRL